MPDKFSYLADRYVARRGRPSAWFRILALVCLVFVPSQFEARAQTQLGDYLPATDTYDSGIPTPEEILGAEVGEWHARHDQVVEYFRTVASASSRVHLEEYGRSHENRPLLLAAVSSPRNIARLEEVRREHLQSILHGEGPRSGPVVIYMGYGVHGNEPSGTNASLLFLYHLAAAGGSDMEEILDNCVVLVDPCLNPDGTNRFANWVNSHRGAQLVADPAHREHREVWPGGRTNHYWFDLNRDWLLLTHPESRGRIRQFQRWRPNVSTDFHEMGTNSTYFFQPGIPSRRNPNTPERNVELTGRIAKYHAKRLDRMGSLYYTEESFDDFYYGKGSTYPDSQGAIGILFEQASSRGHLQESVNGLVSFPFTIRNQLATSFSSLQAAFEMRACLLDYQRDFYRESLALARNAGVQAYVFGTARDVTNAELLVDNLLHHDIEVHRLAQSVTIGSTKYAPQHAFVVPAVQPQYRLVKSVFERRTQFLDDAFYDVSSWTFPLSFGVTCSDLPAATELGDLLGQQVTEAPRAEGSLELAPHPTAFVFRWDSCHAPRALQRLLCEDFQVRVAAKPFAAATVRGRQEFGYGSIVIPVGIQTRPVADLTEALATIVVDTGIDVFVTTTGLTPSGIDLGSPSLKPLQKPSPLVVIGPGVSAYESGEVWHLLDQRYGVPVSLVEIDRLGSVDWKRYTHVILVSGSYSKVSSGVRQQLRDWIRDGGVILSIRGSIAWVDRELLGVEKSTLPGEVPRGEDAGDQDKPPLRYADYEAARAKQLVSGAIFSAYVDPTHPIGYGYSNQKLAVFRNSTNILEIDPDPVTNVVRYTSSPLWSGYCSPENIQKIRDTAVVVAKRVGRGAVIRYVDNPNFRGVWYGTQRLLANGLFFGHTIKQTRRIAEAQDSEAQAIEAQHSEAQ